MVAKVARHFISNVRIQISFLVENVGKNIQHKSGSRGFWSYTLVSFNGTFFFLVPTEVAIFILNHHHPPPKKKTTTTPEKTTRWEMIHFDGSHMFPRWPLLSYFRSRKWCSCSCGAGESLCPSTYRWGPRKMAGKVGLLLQVATKNSSSTNL